MSLQEIIEKLKLDKEQASTLTDFVNDNYTPQDQVQGTQAELDGLKDELAKRDTQIEELSANKELSDELKTEIEEIRANNKKTIERLENERKEVEKEYSLKMALRDVGAINDKPVKAMLDLEEIKLSKDGELIGLDEQIEKLKESDAYLFNDEKLEDVGKEDTSKLGIGGIKKATPPNTKDDNNSPADDSLFMRGFKRGLGIEEE